MINQLYQHLQDLLSNRSSKNPSNTDCDRRNFLRLTSASVAIMAVGVAAPSWATATSLATSTEARKLRLYNTHTGEKLSVTYWANGYYLKEGLEQLNHHLRDHRQNQSTQMDRALFDQLWLLQKETGSTGTFEVISGYRSPKTNALLRKNSSGVARKSYHMQGRAIDVRLSDVPLTTACATAKNLKLGGVGFYSNSNFIHIDTGPVRSWSA